MAIRQLSPRKAWAKLVALAPEREIFLRTGGKVHFLRITTRAQLITAGAVTAFLGGWALATGVMLWSQAHVSIERASLVRERQAVTSREANVDAYRRSVTDMARDIEARQNALEDILRANLGDTAAGSRTDSTSKKEAAAKGTPISDTSPEIGKLERLRDQQRSFETQVAQAAQARLTRVERAIRSFGLNPAALGRNVRAQGGPFVAASGPVASDPALRNLALLLGRLNAMEATLTAIPSGRPTAAPMESSSYGYRRDPFNGMLAFHAGIDFPGRYGQPIVAAARGRVSFVGRMAGYGNVVEIDHGHGILTRYAHLSRFDARVGEKVIPGETIARMGSTGRSTGTHLHFEVRVRGAAVNPRRFLEARQDVLEIQKLAKQRLVRSDRG